MFAKFETTENVITFRIIRLWEKTFEINDKNYRDFDSFYCAFEGYARLINQIIAEMPFFISYQLAEIKKNINSPHDFLAPSSLNYYLQNLLLIPQIISSLRLSERETMIPDYDILADRLIKGLNDSGIDQLRDSLPDLRELSFNDYFIDQIESFLDFIQTCMNELSADETDHAGAEASGFEVASAAAAGTHDTEYAGDELDVNGAAAVASGERVMTEDGSEVINRGATHEEQSIPASNRLGVAAAGAEAHDSSE